MRRILPSLLLLFVVAFGSGCDDLNNTQKPQQKVYQQYLQGLRLFQSQKYQRALKVFLNLQAKNPDQLELMYNLGATYLKLASLLPPKNDQRSKLFEKAERYLKAVLTKGSAALQQRAHHNLGVLYARKRLLEKSFFHFETAAHIASKTLKAPDADSEKNRSLVASLLRQRKRKRKALNRTRVYRFEAKTIKLKTPKTYKHPLQEIALRATFTHKQTGQATVVWGFPTASNRWKIRFVPTRSGKWAYKIRTVALTLPSGKKTRIDTNLHDEGPFNVLPSARPGRVVIAAANTIRLAWKKSKEKLKLKKKQKKTKAAGAKQASKGAKQPLQSKAPKAPKAPKVSNKKPKAGKKKRKLPPKDEALIRWQGIGLAGLFGTKTDQRTFREHLRILRAFAPTGIHVPIHLDRLITQKAKQAPKVNATLADVLAKRLTSLRQNPTDRWVIVATLRAKQKTPKARIQQAIRYLLARYAHVDIVWSLQRLPNPLVETALRTLRKHDPYRQPIALRMLLPRWLAAAKTNTPTKNTTAAKSKPNAKAKALSSSQPPKARQKAKQAKASKAAKGPTKGGILRHSGYFAAMSRKALQKKLTRPWIVDFPLPIALPHKSLMRQWWSMHISGLSASVHLSRPFHADERKEILTWLQKLQEEDKFIPHPYDPKAKKAKARQKAKPTSRPAPKGAPTPRKGQKAKAPTSRPIARKAPTSRPAITKTPFNKRISRPFFTYATVRYHWLKLLNSFRFSEFMRPEMVNVRVPDFSKRSSRTKPGKIDFKKLRAFLKKQKSKDPKVLRKAVQTFLAQQRKAAAKANAAKAASRPAARKAPTLARTAPKARKAAPTSRKAPAPRLAKAPVSRPTSRPLVAKPANTGPRWKEISLRGFIASNSITTIFMAPPSRSKRAPRIRWRDSRWDLEFTWYNALTGKFLKKKLLRQVTSLELTAPKKEAHVAKVSIQDHKLHTPYRILLPPTLLAKHKQKYKDAWRLKGWTLRVKPPQGPPQLLHFVRTTRGYESRLRPDIAGIWSFSILRKNKRLAGIWRFPGKLKVVPHRSPSPIYTHPRNPRYLIANRRPFFFFAKPILGLLSPKWSQKAFGQTLQALQDRYVGATVLVDRLPALPWRTANTKAFQAKAPAWSTAALQQLDLLDERLDKIHQNSLHTGIILPFKELQSLKPAEQQARLFYLLDRFSTAFPIVWFVDLRKAKKLDPKKLQWLPKAMQLWYRMRFPLPAPKKTKKRQGRRVLTPPPLLGAILGKPRSTKRLKAIGPLFRLLWLDVKNLPQERRDFKIDRIARPIVLSWLPSLEPKFSFMARVKGKQKVNTARLQRWTRFLWESQLYGFHHSGRPLTRPLRPQSAKAKKTFSAPERVVAIMRSFFQTFRWPQLRPWGFVPPKKRSVQIPAHQAIGAETPLNPKQKQQPHHIVAWVNKTVRRNLSVKRNQSLKKHRYTWINPLTGKQPITPQLLPPLPTNNKPDKMQLPFRPAVLYIFRRPPQKRRNQRQRKRPKKSKNQKRLSRRQQIRNRLRRLQEDRNKMLRRMLRKQKPKSVSGKRG